MRKFYLIIFLLTVTIGAHAQITIANGTSIATSDDAEVVIQTKGNVSNGSTYDFGNANTKLIFIASTTAQTLTGNFTVSSLTLLSGQNTTVNGNLTITDEVYFNTGVLTPGVNGKIIYRGSPDHINGDEANVLDDSYVNGILYEPGNGRNLFPVGKLSIGYAPATLEDVDGGDEIGIEVMDTDAELIANASDALGEIDRSRYWEITATDVAAIDSKITLSTDGIDFLNGELSPIVLQAESAGATAESLLGINNGNTITSRKSVTKPIVVIGGSLDVSIVIHDIITPFTTGGNDYLVIENIDKFLVNKVTLLDRWGVLVKTWTNFTNYDAGTTSTPNQDGYDFKKLSPGSYICVVEYGDPDVGFSKKSQMITVLKAK